MPILFWVDIAALSLSVVIMASLALVVMGSRPERALNRSFTLFALTGAAWAVAALLLRLSLWLDPSLPAGPSVGDAVLWLELTGLFLALMGNFAARFTVRFLERRTSRTDLIVNLGLLLALVFAVPLFNHQLIFNPSLGANGMVIEELAPWGMVTAMIVVGYLVWALVLWWQERGRVRAPNLAISMAVLLAGILFGGVLDVSFPFLSISNAVSAAVLGYAIVVRQLFNPLRELTAELQSEIADREQSEARFRALSAATFEGIGFHDQGVILDANQQFAEMLGYEVDELPGKLLSELVAPADWPLVQSKTLTAGDEPYEHRSVRKDGSIISVEVHSRTISLGDRPMRVTAIRDITQWVQAEEALRTFTQRLQVLREIDQGILTARSPEAIAQVAVAHIRRLVPGQRASVVLFDLALNEGIVLAVDGDASASPSAGTRIPLEPFANLMEESWGRGKIRRGTLQSLGAVGDAPRADGLDVYLSAPLVFQGELIGTLVVTADDPEALNEEHDEIVQEVADLLAIAIQQARLRDQVESHAEELERRVASRTRELSVLYEVAALASQPLNLKIVLAKSLAQVLDAVGGDSGAVHLLDEANGSPADGTRGERMFRLTAQHGIRSDLLAQLESLPADEGLGQWILEHDEPLVLPDITSDPRTATRLPVEPRAYLGVPLRASGRIVGVLGIVRRPDQPQLSVEELSLLGSIADQLGIVVESSRLQARAEQAVRLEERERLARELHDSITQSLYSLTLFAEWGRDLYEDGELEAVKERLIRIGETAQQALKEMRLLIYELRPSLMAQDGLVRALQRRLDAVEKRSGVAVLLEAEPMIGLPARVEFGLYRIAQEALNNALKHAAASQVTVRVANDGGRVTLEVKDDGAGFEPDSVGHGGGMGIIGMRERARGLDSQLVVASAPGEGTSVAVTVEVFR